MYGSTTTAIASLISLANIGPRVKSHFQLPSSLPKENYPCNVHCDMIIAK